MRWLTQICAPLVVLFLGATPARAYSFSVAHADPAFPSPAFFQPAATLVERADRPFCLNCASHWRVALRMALQDEQPQFALRLTRPLTRQGGIEGWHLGVAAHALVQPGERRVVAAVCRSQRNSQFEAGLEAMEADLMPVADQPYLPKRSLRRRGAVVAWQVHSHGPGQRPTVMGMLPGGVVLGGTLRLWQASSVAERPVLDSQLRITLGTPALSAASARRQQAWADIGWRGLVGSEDRLLAAGGWQMPGALGGQNHHVLKQSILGYEDMVRYTARTVHAQVGASALLGPRARMDVFVSATQIDTLAQRPGRWLRSVGARLNVTSPSRRGLIPTVSYQVARRIDGSRGPWLHMLTASL